MSRKISIFAGIAIILVGIVLLLNAFSGITGFVIFSGLKVQSTYLIGLAMVVGGIVMLASASGLEKIVVYLESPRKGKSNRPYTSIKNTQTLTGGSPILQANEAPALDEYHINLKEFKGLVKDKLISRKDIASFKQKHEKEFLDVIRHGYRDFFEYKCEHPRPDGEQREEVVPKEIISGWQKARGTEKAYKLIDPEFETRTERVIKLKDRPRFVYNPIREGKAAYVHLTKGKGVADMIDQEGLKAKGEQHAFYFASWADAEAFVTAQTAKQASAGVVGTDAIIFQTAEVPDILPLSGVNKGANYQAVFRGNLDRDLMYKFKKVKI